jgi:flagellar basal-body rod protein FlgB
MAALDDIPILSMLRSKMAYLNQRKVVIAQNVANSDTPGYTPKDLRSFDRVLAAHTTTAAQPLVRSDPMHLEPPSAKGGMITQPINSPDSETTMNGNSVVQEEEMMKLSETLTGYDTAVTLYQQATNMLRTAVKRPGA